MVWGIVTVPGAVLFALQIAVVSPALFLELVQSLNYFRSQ